MILGLTGFSGAGKSTLLRTLTGEQKALEGTLTLYGKTLETYSRSDRARLIAVVLTQKVEAPQMLAEEVEKYATEKIPAILPIPGVSGNTGAGIKCSLKSGPVADCPKRFRIFTKGHDAD